MTDPQPKNNPRENHTAPNEPSEDANTVPDPTDAVDTVKCRIEGIKAQAEINEQSGQKLVDARTKFESVRLEYISTRDQNDDTIRQLGDQVTTLVARIRCRFSDPEVPKRLEEACKEVTKKIDTYKPKQQPGAEATSKDSGTDDPETLPNATDIRKVRATRQRLQDDLSTALERFDYISNEPGALSERIAKCKDEIAAAEKGSESNNETELAESFTRALVAQYHEASLTGEFDTSRQFIAALARELETLTKAANNVGIAAGVEARLACLESASLARYRALQDALVAEIIAAYQFKRRGTDSAQPGSGPPPQAKD